MTQESDRKDEVTPVFDAPDFNPWLLVTGLLAAVAFFVGIGMYNANKPEAFDEGDPQLQLVGIWLMGASVIALALWAAAGAVCWQLKRTQ